MHKNVIDGRKHFIGRVRKRDENDLDKLRINDSVHNEGTICLVNDGFSSVGTRTDAIKLAMAGT